MSYFVIINKIIYSVASQTDFNKNLYLSIDIVHKKHIYIFVSLASIKKYFNYAMIFAACRRLHRSSFCCYYFFRWSIKNDEEEWREGKILCTLSSVYNGSIRSKVSPLACFEWENPTNSWYYLTCGISLTRPVSQSVSFSWVIDDGAQKSRLFCAKFPSIKSTVKVLKSTQIL